MPSSCTDMAAPTRSLHPFAPVWDEACRVLVLGSHPSVLSKQNGFYYMNPHNRFWPMLSALLGEDLVAADAESKTRLLLAHHVALHDVVSGCDIVGSQDATIRDVAPADLAPLVEGAPIDVILLNGKTAYTLFCRHFPQYAARAVCMPSTSPANAKLRLADLVEAWRPYMEQL